MIERPYLLEWRQYAPWRLDSQVEQDLVLSRALVEIFSDEFLNAEFALRGGTALNKIFLKENLRYSEDIDLVRTKAEKAKPIIATLQKRLDPWLGKPAISQKKASVVLIYRFTSSSEPIARLRLKIEMNTRESKPSLPHIQKTFHVKSRWFSGTANIRTYEIEEILASKLRALYRRNKGRDLLDFDYTFREYPSLDLKLISRVFNEYETRDKLTASRADFERNLFEKMQDENFLSDTLPLLTPAARYDPKAAYSFILQKIAPLLPGEPWKGYPDSDQRSP